MAPEFAENTFRDFCWARITASSRIFGLNIHGNKTDAFVPLADMLNHRIPKQTSWTYSDEREGFIIEAMEDIERGEQVYDSYGRKCNSRFFLNYGFINMDNDANEVAVAVHFDKDDPSLKQKEEMMMEKAQPKIIRILDNYEENNVLEFFGYLRFISLKDSQKLLVLQNIYESQMSQTNDNQTNSKQFKPSKTPPISVENESEMWARVKAICQTSLAKYKTTLEEDRELLKGNSLTQNQKNCTLIRLGEKEILHFYITMAPIMMDLYSRTKKEVSKMQSKKEFNPYLNYITKVMIPLFNKHTKQN